MKAVSEQKLKTVYVFGKQGERMLLVGNRIPQTFFVTSGIGESDITVHAGSYHLALKEAGIERCNIIVYSSILPGIANEIKKPNNFPDNLVHGAVMETIMAAANSDYGKRATAGIIFGWLFDKQTGEKYGGLVCEYNGDLSESEAKKSLRMSLQELYTNGYSEKFILKEDRVIIRSFVPKKKFGTSIVALCFTDYLYPVLQIAK
ncbi:pyruvoyl-dependent arginine decarboxylase [Candidatus Woesearchaeota archaeon]|nr:pyruvoyl-dependent arginine decarboxylase [Candidatus Woesearchaeota archaeon]